MPPLIYILVICLVLKIGLLLCICMVDLVTSEKPVPWNNRSLYLHSDSNLDIHQNREVQNSAVVVKRAKCLPRASPLPEQTCVCISDDEYLSGSTSTLASNSSSFIKNQKENLNSKLKPIPETNCSYE